MREEQVSRKQRSAPQVRMSHWPIHLGMRNVPFTGAILLTLVLFSLGEITNSSIAAREDATLYGEATGNNLREVIHDRFQKRYLKWKAEYLSTEAGRELWKRYARNSAFTLTITVSAEKGKNAEVGGYRWDEGGRLIAATIMLGSQIDKGYPNPFTYPVTSSLAPTEFSPHIDGSVLAATKLAHEFGHINYAANSDTELFQVQNKLIPIYNKIFFANGRNIHDPQLVELAEQMKGIPSKIGRDRELWAEASALTYLREKCPEEKTCRPIFKTIQRAIKEYAKEHMERFR